MLGPARRTFRARLTATFFLMAAVTSGAVSVTSYALVEQYRHNNFASEAENKARLGLLSVRGDIDLSDFELLLGDYQERGGFETLVVTERTTLSSRSDISSADVPPELADEVPRGVVTTVEATIRGSRYLVAAGRPASSDATIFFFFDKTSVVASIQEMRNALAVAWVLCVAIAAVFGRMVAKRTLRPVDEAARAAHSLAEGLLDTRLASGGRDEFGTLALSFNEMAQALEGKIHELSRVAARERRLTANVTHELRTPVTGMVSAASLLEANIESIPEPARRAAALLVADARRLDALVGELLELARIDAGQETVDLEVLRLRPAVLAAVSPWGGATAVEVDVADELTVLADRPRFRRVLTNLVANAHQHGAPPVTVRAQPGAGCVAIHVSDHGPGIQMEDTAQVFDRFFKGDRSRSGAGAGLGLAIAREQARLQEGQLAVCDEHRTGACFTFVLASPGAAQEDQEPTRQGIQADAITGG